MDYKQAKEWHSKNIYEKFNTDPTYLFLNQFMKAGNKELQQEFFNFLEFKPKASTLDKKFQETFNYVKSKKKLLEIKRFIKNNKTISIWYNAKETQNIIQELKGIPLFHDEFSPINSIDKQLFSKVQNVSNKTDLKNVVNIMNNMLKKKIYWTYYNTQTTRIIEDIFSIHQNIIPTLVDIKGVDFFIDNLPIDLKITRLPKIFNENFISSKLIKWFYENQSEQRFGAENRLFLVLNDKKNPEKSDLLRITHYEYIKKQINDYLDKFSAKQMKNIKFLFNNKTYNVKSDLIFINI